eukprot:gene1149-842_t
MWLSLSGWLSIASFTPSENFVQQQLAETSSDHPAMYDLQGPKSCANFGSALDLLSMYDDNSEDVAVTTSEGFEDDSAVDAAVVPTQTAIIASDIVLTVGFQHQDWLPDAVRALVEACMKQDEHHVKHN